MTEYIYIIKSTKIVKIKQNLTSFNSKEEIKMRVTIDLDRDIIIISDNFFKKISEENEKLEKFGVQPVKAIERIKRSFDEAMKDTDNRLLTQTNAKIVTRIRNSDKKDNNIDTNTSASADNNALADKK